MISSETVLIIKNRIIDAAIKNQRPLPENQYDVFRNEISSLITDRINHFFSITDNDMFESDEFRKYLNNILPIEVLATHFFSDQGGDELSERIMELVNMGREYLNYDDSTDNREDLHKLLKTICFCFDYISKNPNIESIIKDNSADLRLSFEKITNNVYLSRKEHIQNANVFPIAHQLTNINRLTFLNFASSTFISGQLISGSYSDYYSQWYFENLKSGDLVTNVIINNPHSFAAKDAALSKMNPKDLRIKEDEIIQHNINVLYDFCQDNSRAKINLYLTDICLPYGIMFGENYLDSSMDFMKVDLYSPLGNQSDVDGYDNERPSFYLLGAEDKTRDIFDIFIKALGRVKNDPIRTKTVALHGKRNIDWMYKKPFIHRGKIEKNIPDHSVRGFLGCLKQGYPMEVDVFSLKDGEIIVGRDEQIISKETGRIVQVSQLSLVDIRKLKTNDYTDKNGDQLRYCFEELMTLSELLNMVNGDVDLLIEIKTDDNESEDIIKKLAASVVDKLRYYTGEYAIHSANPYILKSIRELDRIVALGQISWSFNGVQVSEEFKTLHTEFRFFEVLVPDFISYKVEEINGNARLRSICDEKGIPLFAWAVTNRESEISARKNKCDNIIIEGATTYLYD